MNGRIEKDISNVFNKLKIAGDDRKIDDLNDVKLSLLKSKILNAIDQIKQMKKRPDLNTIYEYPSKTEASNADKQLIETILDNLIETNITVNKKAPKGLDSFHRLEVVQAPVHALDTDAKQGNIASNAETQTEFPKREWFSLITRETQTERKLTVDAMVQTDRVYISDWSGDTTQECINIDMIRLLKDEIAYLRGELSS